MLDIIIRGIASVAALGWAYDRSKLNGKLVFRW